VVGWKKGDIVNKKWLVISSLLVVVLAFVAGTVLFRSKSNQEVSQALQNNNEALIRAHAPIYGNLAAKVTIVEFFDPSCETCRAFFPVVKSIVNSSFGQVRLVVRYAALHPGSDTAIKILEAARKQGVYWQAVEKALAAQPQWAAHGNPQPELLWEVIKDTGLDVAKAKSEANSPEIERLLQQDLADMRALKVDKTPGFFVNGTPLRDFGEAQLKALVDQEVAKAKVP